jgi:hypothetical protein
MAITLPSCDGAVAATQREVPYALTQMQICLAKVLDPEREIEWASRNDSDVVKNITSEHSRTRSSFIVVEVNTPMRASRVRMAPARSVCAFLPLRLSSRAIAAPFGVHARTACGTGAEGSRHFIVSFVFVPRSLGFFEVFGVGRQFWVVYTMIPSAAKNE